MENQNSELGADLGPIAGLERISSIDTIRGVALFGILLLNIVAFGLPYAYSNPTHYGGAEGLNFAVWTMNNLFFEVLPLMTDETETAPSRVHEVVRVGGMGVVACDAALLDRRVLFAALCGVVMALKAEIVVLGLQ